MVPLSQLLALDTLLFLAFSISILPCSSATTKAQNKCASLVQKWLTRLLQPSQIIQLFDILNEGIYEQLPTSNITTSVGQEALKLANPQQTVTVLTGYGRLKADLGSNYDSVFGKVSVNINGVLDEVFNELKALSKSLQKKKVAKSKVITKQYNKLNSFVKAKVQKAFTGCSKSSSLSTGRWWKPTLAQS